MSPTFSLVVNHAPWIKARRDACREMLCALVPLSRGVPFFLNDKDWRPMGDWQQSKVQWALDQWEWSVGQRTTHHVFMTDDLHIAPGFWDILGAMVTKLDGHDCPIGLLSNHPRGPELFAEGKRWYRTNSWIVGPAYVLPHQCLLEFLQWFKGLEDGPHTAWNTKAYRNDDSSINEFVTKSGRWTAHPLPTIIEHRDDLESTVGHGDRHSRERVSWRALRTVREIGGDTFEWVSAGLVGWRAVDLAEPSFWGPAALSPLLSVGES